MSDHQPRIRMVVCGSIGLEPIVRRVGLSHTIAHLRAFDLAPWDRATADACLAALASRYSLALPPEVRGAMLDRLGWYVPHHVQLYFSQLLDDCRRRSAGAAAAEDAARVYDRNLLGPRSHAVLADYEERLLRVLDPGLVPLAIELLTEAAVTGLLAPEAARALAQGLNPEARELPAMLRSVIDVLEHDGYLVYRDGPPPGHAFVSGLIRDWWKRRFGAGHIPASQREP